MREFLEPSASTKIYKENRDCWRRDYGRIVHSHAFRRLQGKTQLFPGLESDFFRNRLTHSIEVAQIGKSIAQILNVKEHFFHLSRNAINPDIVEIAGLAHDLGHPPFGHNGEEALNEWMGTSGGFEGNAQTIRILAKIEKKYKMVDSSSLGIYKGLDRRYGLNLCFRVLASVLKYDKEIPQRIRKVHKGYYKSESTLVRLVKRKLVGSKFGYDFKTIECCIMDIADDIAYAVYDLEDALKCGFISPFDFIDIDDLKAQAIADEMKKRLKYDISINLVKKKAQSLFSWIVDYSLDKKVKYSLKDNISENLLLIKNAHKSFTQIAQDGYFRTDFSSRLIKLLTTGVRVTENERFPILTKVFMEKETRLITELLKCMSYVYLIDSPRMQMTKQRGKDIIDEICEAFDEKDKKGYLLLPEDFRKLYLEIRPSEKKRIICDFIAGMTDRYAMEYYGRLKSENPQSIFKPY